MESPYLKTGEQAELLHDEPVGHLVQDGPQAWLSLDASTHEPAHRVKPVVHVKPQVVAEHVAVAFGGVLHAAHRPPQHMPAEHDVASGTSPVAVHVACPVLHEIVPV